MGTDSTPPHGPDHDLRSDPLAMALLDVGRAYLVRRDGSGRIGVEPVASRHDAVGSASRFDGPDRQAILPALTPRDLGDAAFRKDHGTDFALYAGAMANGIASEDLVEAMAGRRMLAFFGAAGLPMPRVTRAIDRIQSRLHADAPYGFNLIHSPGEPAMEREATELYLNRGVRRIEASAFLRLTPAVVRYRVAGLGRDGQGRISIGNRVVAKVSREEVAAQFLAPAPEPLVNELLRIGAVTPEQAELARLVPMADDLTAEADSGGHTDNRAAITLVPLMTALRDRLARDHGYADRIRVRVGAGGGIATPASAAAALAMGADYLVTGTVNQACRESGSSDAVRAMLAQARQADITMAPAADMFEMGVKVQVLKRGTMFAMRAARLYEIYRRCASLEAIPAEERADLERKVFRQPLEAIWEKTQAFFQERDPTQIARAEEDPKHKLALVFRWYLGLSSAWANSGEPDRAMDYQVWCGPAMGAFNEWVRGTFLEAPEHRRVALVNWNILRGAAVLQRANLLRAQGIEPPASAWNPRPVADDAFDEDSELGSTASRGQATRPAPSASASASARPGTESARLIAGRP